MDEFRRWWADMVKRLLAWIGDASETFFLGVTRNWNLSGFVFVVGVVVIVWGILLWRRKA